MSEENKEKLNDKDQEHVKNYYQGIFVTETVLGNPNGSFMENEPRNIKGRIFTTDKCIKYNIRNFIHQKYEEVKKSDEQIKSVKDFVFFYPRKKEGSKIQEEKYLKKDRVFKKFFLEPYDERPFEKLLENCVDARMFGGTFSFDEDELNKYQGSIYGPIQLSYGLDLIGADIINPQLGTPFASEEGEDESGQQTTTGQDYLVDHAVIGYDITINPNNEIDLLKNEDLKKFKEGIVNGTNLRKSTSKKTNSKVLLLVKFQENTYPNLGDLKTLIEVESDKISEEEKNKGSLILNFENVKEELKKFKDKIENIELYKASDVEIKEFNELDREDGDTKEVKIKELTSL